MTNTELDILTITWLFIALIALGAILGEVAVWIMQRLGFGEDDPTDFMARLEAGEVLDKDNIFK